MPEPQPNDGGRGMIAGTPGLRRWRFLYLLIAPVLLLLA